MIKNLLFDMGGVIFRQNSEEAYRRFRAMGVNTDDYMGEYGQKGFFLDVETGKIDAGEFCRRMAEAAGRESVSWDEAQHLLKLRTEYHVCLLSNTNPFIMAFTRSDKFSDEHKPISDYFDTLFCSYEMRAYKPEPDIFLKALAADGMKAEETIFVDDSLKNIRAAEALGIRGLHVAPDEDWMEKLTALLHTCNGL